MKRWVGVVATVGVAALVVIAGVQVYGLVESIRDRAAASEFAVSACRGMVESIDSQQSSDFTVDIWLTQLRGQIAQASRATRLDPSLAPLEQGLRLRYQISEGNEWAAKAPERASAWRSDSLTYFTNFNAAWPAMEAVCKDLGVPLPAP